MTATETAVRSNDPPRSEQALRGSDAEAGDLDIVSLPVPLPSGAAELALPPAKRRTVF